MKKIGITPLITDVYDCHSDTVLTNYIELIRYMNSIPIILPSSPSNDEVNYYFNEIDVLILQGGDNSSDEQRMTEFSYIKKAMELNVPILGICRGLQELNVYFGGTLCDIGNDSHNSKDYGETIHHNAIIKKESKTYSFINKGSIGINSLHIEQIDRLAEDYFDVSMISEDGIIEGIEFKDSTYLILGYQFHPEILISINNKDGINLINGINKLIDIHIDKN